jgi:hypothetical protein
MAELTLQYPDDLLVASGNSRSEVERELKFQLAARTLKEVDGWELMIDRK